MDIAPLDMEIKDSLPTQPSFSSKQEGPSVSYLEAIYTLQVLAARTFAQDSTAQSEKMDDLKKQHKKEVLQAAGHQRSASRISPVVLMVSAIGSHLVKSKLSPDSPWIAMATLIAEHSPRAVGETYGGHLQAKMKEQEGAGQLTLARYTDASSKAGTDGQKKQAFEDLLRKAQEGALSASRFG